MVGWDSDTIHTVVRINYPLQNAKVAKNETIIIRNEDALRPIIPIKLGFSARLNVN